MKVTVIIDKESNKGYAMVQLEKIIKQEGVVLSIEQYKALLEFLKTLEINGRD